MATIVIQNPSGGYRVDAGAIIMYYGTEAELPSSWDLYADASGVLVKGASTANTTPSGSSSHTHSYGGSTTSTKLTHRHALSDSGNSGGVASTSSATVYGPGSSTASGGGHTHPMNASSYYTNYDGSHSHSLSDTELGDSMPPYTKLFYIKANTSTTIPIKGIIIFSEDYGGKPTDFYICNGGNYDGLTTPDLRDRFILGGTTGDSPGVIMTGGTANSHTHSNSNSSSAGGHDHAAVGGSTGNNSGGTVGVSSVVGGTNVTEGTHSHSWTFTPSTSGAHAHSLSNTNSGDASPPYIKLYYLMRTK